MVHLDEFVFVNVVPSVQKMYSIQDEQLIPHWTDVLLSSAHCYVWEVLVTVSIRRTLIAGYWDVC